MIQAASKYQPVPARRATAPQASAFQILVKKHRKMQSVKEWFHQEMKEGNYIHRYIEREKRLAERRWKKVAQRVHGFKQNNKSDLKVVAHVPLRDWVRMKNEDKDFWNDNSNLKSLRRDVPHAAIYI